jgi:hypothetical protein
MARERLYDSNMQPMRLRLIGTRNKGGRQYNLPNAHEVVSLIPGDGNHADSELHPSFTAL